MTKKITCSVVGARGYTGLETARLLLQHPNAKLTHCFATTHFKLENFLSNPRAEHVGCYPDTEIFKKLSESEVVFLATPAEVSLKLAPEILARGKSIIDLSGAFRLKNNDYQKWYGFEHTEQKILAEAQYGLCPWVGPTKKTKLVANPGCFASAVSMALIPLLLEQVIHDKGIVIDAKSGATGAGKKAAENLLFTEVDNECLPYKIGRHQHTPEIMEAVAFFSGREIDPHFTTSLLPVRRGIIAGIYCELKEGKTEKDVSQAFKDAYSEYPLVSFDSATNSPTLLSLKKVVGTGRTHISYAVVGKKLYVFSCIDNLLKGAASQALENFNRISDLPISLGVSHLEAQT